MQASFGSCTPYDQPTPEQFADTDVDCNYASAKDRKFSIISDYGSTNKPADWVVFEGTIKENWREIVDTHKSKKPFAKIYFKLKGVQDIKTFNNAFPKEIPYITWKLSGLPRKLVDDTEGKKIESLAKIKVTGSPEAVKLLSP